MQAPIQALIEMSRTFIEAYGYVGVFVLTTLEHFVFPIPADLFIGMGTGAGMNLSIILILVLMGSLLGSVIGYFLGKYLGHPAAVWLLGKKQVEKGEVFIQKWGIFAVIIAGLTPIPFKVIVWLSGIFEMPVWKFILGVIIGRMPRYILVAYAGSFFYQNGFQIGPEMSAMILGTLQGVAEFLPISSSGHLVIMEHFLKLPIGPETLMSFDIFLHGGSLLAILIYFRKDWVQVFKELWDMLKKRRVEVKSLSFMLAAATIPAIFAALTLGDLMEGPLRSLKSVGLCFILTSLVFFYVSWQEKKLKLWEHNVNLKRAILIGIAQAIAILPGVSRSGSTIAAGIFMGISREQAARFSFMLGGVAILAANVYSILFVGDTPLPDLKFTLIGTFTSFVMSLLTISFLLKFLKKYSLKVFAVYLMLAGVGVLTFF